jgi:hypothetical protein
VIFQCSHMHMQLQGPFGMSVDGDSSEFSVSPAQSLHSPLHSIDWQTASTTSDSTVVEFYCAQ